MSELNPGQSNEVSKQTKELEKAITERLEHLQDKGERSRAEHGAEKPAADQLEAIRDKINETATQKSELAGAVAAVPEDTTRQQVYLDKKGARQAKLKEVQSNLAGSDKVFSKVIHNPVVTTVSDAVSNTVARPTSLFWGGLFACLTSAFLYFTAKYIGFNYNYLVSIISFVGGYVVGLVVELLLRLVRRPASS